MSTPTEIADLETLRATYPPTHERARLKTLARLDEHMRQFIALSPFMCMGTSSEGGADVTPRGDQPGFVQVPDETTLLIPDWPGNNRLDSLSNLVANPQVGLLFMIPGVNETLRVNGVAEISTASELVERWNVSGKRPRAVLRVSVREAYMHCGKALIRSRLWDPASQIARDRLLTYGQMLKDQASVRESAEEIQASVLDGYKRGLY